MSKCDRFFDVFKNAEYDLYPIVIMQSRSGGTYEGGKWIAIGNFSSSQDAGLSDYVSGDDGDAVDFWSSDRSLLIGRGQSPNDATRDLCLRNNFSYLDLIRTFQGWET